VFRPFLTGLIRRMQAASPRTAADLHTSWAPKCSNTPGMVRVDVLRLRLVTLIGVLAAMLYCMHWVSSEGATFENLFVQR
jgi:hypothetical protein